MVKTVPTKVIVMAKKGNNTTEKILQTRIR